MTTADLPRARGPLRVWTAALAGVGLGAVRVPVDLVAAVLPAVRGRVVATELRRSGRFHGPVDVPVVEPGRTARYLPARAAVGALGAGVVLVLVVTVAVGLSVLSAWALDGDWGLVSDRGRVTTEIVALGIAPGLLLLFLVVVGVLGVGALDRWLAETLLGPARDLRQRVARLTAVRDEVVDAVDEERRRIERDLHDGLQQRLVALGVTIGRARRAGDDRAPALLDEAAAICGDAVRELREVSDRIHPAVLADGLAPALDRLREHAGITVELDCRVPDRLRPALETAAWFAVSETVTNAAKHSGAERVHVEAVALDRLLTVTVTDDGRGGADPRGSGLLGIVRRVEALDGSLRVDSPAGGPTRVEVVIPCA